MSDEMSETLYMTVIQKPDLCHIWAGKKNQIWATFSCDVRERQIEQIQLLFQQSRFHSSRMKVLLDYPH